MSVPHRPFWLRVAILVGAVYALVGIAFALPTTHVRAWRLAVWLVCAVAYAAHIAYERFRLKQPTVSAALHIALAAALGAFLVAVAANVHSLGSDSAEHRLLLLLALVLWPFITMVPAFLVALVVNAVLARVFPIGPGHPSR